MAARPNPQLVEALVQGRPSAGDDPQHHQAAAWMRGEASLEGLSEDVALAALEAAVRGRAVERLQSLEQSGPKALRKAARAALHKLRSLGVNVETNTPGRAFVLGEEAISAHGTAWLSVDESQAEGLTLLVWWDAEGSCALLARLRPSTGLSDMEHAHLSRNGGRAMVRDMQSRIQGLVEVPFEAALSLALRGLDQALVERGELPHDWDHFAGHIPAPVLERARQAEPLGALPERWDADRLTELLLHTEPTSSFWPVSDAALQAVEEAQAATGDLSDLDEDSREQAHAAHIAQGVERIWADPTVKEGWSRGARLCALVAQAEGRGEAAACWAALAAAVDRGIDPLELPLARLAVQSFAAIVQLRRGADAAELPDAHEHDHTHSHDHDHTHEHTHAT